MRKLGILLAVMIAATLGYSGTASAQTFHDDPSGTGTTICEGAEGFEGQAGPLEPVRQGFVDNGCTEGDGGGEDGNPLCDGLDQLPEEFAPLSDPIKEGAECGGGGDDKNTKSDDDDDDDDDTQSQVKAQNAASDGSLPRTGGELFAGAGLGLMSLGTLVRRFLP